MTKLDEAIALNGRSLAQEMEARISGHFNMEEMLGGPWNMAFHCYLGRRIAAIQESAGGARFDEDDAVWAATREVLLSVLDAARPPRMQLQAAIERETEGGQ